VNGFCAGLAPCCIPPENCDTSARGGQPLRERATKNASSTNDDRNILRQIEK
jgi:hypothetical protein